MNMIFRDLHQLGKKGFIEEIITGVVIGVEITDELMVVGCFLAEILILMVLLTRILDDRWNKWANIVAGIITLVVYATAAPSADVDDIFFMIIEVVAILWIFRITARLPSLDQIHT